MEIASRNAAVAAELAAPGSPTAEAMKHNFALTSLPEKLGPIPAETASLAFFFLFQAHVILRDWDGSAPNRVKAGLRSAWAGVVGIAASNALPAVAKAVTRSLYQLVSGLQWE
jgi:hypothetical protein